MATALVGGATVQNPHISGIATSPLNRLPREVQLSVVIRVEDLRSIYRLFLSCRHAYNEWQQWVLTKEIPWFVDRVVEMVSFGKARGFISERVSAFAPHSPELFYPIEGELLRKRITFYLLMETSQSIRI